MPKMVGATTLQPQRSSIASAVVLILLTILVYLPVVHGGFLWDDDVLVTENQMIKARDGLYRFWFTTEAPDYYPLTSTLFWLEWRLWGNNAPGYHLVNVLLHAVNAVLVWRTLRRLKIPGAWLAGLVFAMHPVNVATVGWISEQKSTLSMLFYLLTILLYLKFDGENNRRWYGLSFIAFLLALLSKSAVVMLPVILLGCVWWIHGRVVRRDIARTLPFFALSFLTGLSTIWLQSNNVLQGEAVLNASFAGRLAIAGWLPWFYLSKAALPFNLAVIYPKWAINPTQVTSWLPGVMLAVCFLMFWSRRKTWGRPLLFGFGYFVVTLFPVLGFFDQGFYRFSLAADHWQYYAIIGVIALGVATGNKICECSASGGRSLKVLVSVVVILTLGAGTWRRSSLYADDESLWRNTLALNPNAWVAYNNLGTDLVLAGKIQEATGHYERALRLRPDYAEAYDNLGIALLRSGKAEEAIPNYKRALQLIPDYPEAEYNLGVALGQVGRNQEAMDHFKQALLLKPDYAEAHCNLGIALGLSGKIAEAIKHFEQAVRLSPDYAEAHCNLGIALGLSGNRTEAVAHLRQALRLKPDYAQAQNALVWLQARQ